MLSKYERMVLINQYQILELVDPENADDHKVKRLQLEEGFSSEYIDEINSLFDELPKNECDFVWDVLNMYDALWNAANHMDVEDELQYVKDHTFPGFDGNHEGPYYRFCSFILKMKNPYELNFYDPDRLNSHAPMKEKYLRMLAVWKEVNDQREGDRMYTYQQVNDILDA